MLNINLDMIGRTSIKDTCDNYLSIQYTKEHDLFGQMFQNKNETNKINLDIRYNPEKQPRGASDFVSFAAEGIPVISLFAGLHRDYHMPSDEIEFIDIEKMTNIIKLTYLGLNDILGMD